MLKWRSKKIKIIHVLELLLELLSLSETVCLIASALDNSIRKVKEENFH